ncbi:tripartite tricarboxylate transporter substrate binding protein [Roseomonas sp. OT10]|uniref:tripartite tricarboxylate transporter substrate binding protein n=1 Tax=Roseomonas cutis TaxID=2897332 RepID=UPI001E632AFB|nr:tripartite tricarboxylate transporter substrate binding protein [Roseomonas sp. OT10]UFN48208.1 tripartite tricarboxylate transporter substrate binding protein [Roseomonas sp. OT10]
MTNERLSRRATLMAAAALATPAAAADYPSRPVELVVPSSAGGGTDIVARAFADVARKYFPQPVIVLNRPGASGAIGMGEVMNARPDGYKLGMLIVELQILQLIGQARFGTDDFRLIAKLNGDPAALLVPVNAPWATIEEFIADAKKRPGKISVGNSGVGSIWHLGAAALEEKTGTEFLHVPYAGSAPGLLALIGGHVDSMVVSPGEATAHVQGGKLRILAVMADQRQAAFPDAPTLKERGIDLSLSNWRAVALPKATPQPVVEAVAELTRKVAADPAFREAIGRSNLGFSYMEPAEFQAAILQEREFFRQITRNLQLN